MILLPLFGHISLNNVLDMKKRYTVYGISVKETQILTYFLQFGMMKNGFLYTVLYIK